MIPTCIMVHPVGTVCNIACKYCFYRKTRVHDFSKKMSAGLFLDFFEKWVSVIPENRSCDVIWHGGEPTLRGKVFFEEVFKVTKKITPSNKLVGHSLQTNGLLIDDEWCDLFKRFGVEVGISIDFPDSSHDKMRVTKEGVRTFSKVIDSYYLLCKHSLDVGVVTVVNKQNVTKPDQVFDFALKYGVKKLQLSPCMEIFQGSDDFSITPDEFSNFILRIFDRWFSLDDPTFTIGFIEDVVKHLLGFKQDNCMLNDSCHNFAVLDWIGILKTCDGMRCKQSNMGDNTKKHIASPEFKRNWVAFHEKITKQRESECAQCEWYGLCYGGCPYHWFEENGLFKTAFCRSYKVIFSHIATALLKKMS